MISKSQLGQFVKKAREHKSKLLNKRYTQGMLANDIKKSQSYIGDIESGRTYPTFIVICDIADACEVPFSFFTNVTFGELIEHIVESIPDLARKQEELVKFTDFIITMHANSEDGFNLPSDSDTLKSYYSSFRDIMCKTEITFNSDIDKFKDKPVSKNTDIKESLNKLLSQPNLTLNGKILSDDIKLALKNTITLGLQHAELMQKIDLKND